MSAISDRSRWQRAAAAGDARAARALTPGEIAWVVLLPCTLVTLAAIVLLGPPLGHVLARPTSDYLWPSGWWLAPGAPEPTEQGRYALAALAPALLGAAILAGARRPPRPRPGTRALMAASQLLVVAVLAVALLGQHGAILVADPPLHNEPQHDIFGVVTLVVAAALVAAAVAAMRRGRVTGWLSRHVRETSGRRIAALAIAGLFATSWLLKAVVTDGLVEDQGQLNWTANEAFAVLAGRTPLVDYHAMYGKLAPYPAALAMALLGTNGFVYTALMAVLSVLALLAVFEIFRRVVGSSLLALGMFLPFVALSDIDDPMIMAALWPMRYGGAYLLAWLTARHIDGAGPRRLWILFFVGGLVAIDNLEFGVGAVAASGVALLCARPPRSARSALRLAGSVAAGTLGAVALVSLFTYVRAGALPDPNQLLEWPRIFSSLGLLLLPMPAASLHLAVYATFVAAIAVAVVRLVRATSDVLLTSMLMWSGTFGLIAGTYYAGRSEDLKLVSMFSAWAFALALLTVVVVRALQARRWQAPTIPELLVLFGFALAICSISRISPPTREIARLTRTTPPVTYRATAEQLVREHTEPGETVAILLPENFRIAYDLGLENVAPYVMPNSIVTWEQMQLVIATVKREGVRSIFMPTSTLRLLEAQSAPEQLQLLADEGYPVVAETLGMLVLSRDPEA